MRCCSFRAARRSPRRPAPTTRLRRAQPADIGLDQPQKTRRLLVDDHCWLLPKLPTPLRTISPSLRHSRSTRTLTLVGHGDQVPRTVGSRVQRYGVTWGVLYRRTQRGQIARGRRLASKLGDAAQGRGELRGRLSTNRTDGLLPTSAGVLDYGPFCFPPALQTHTTAAESPALTAAEIAAHERICRVCSRRRLTSLLSSSAGSARRTMGRPLAGPAHIRRRPVAPRVWISAQTRAPSGLLLVRLDAALPRLLKCS